MKPMQVIIPMAGVGQRFRNAGYTVPKPLLDIVGQPLIERLVHQFPASWRFLFICNEKDLAETPLRGILLRLIPEAQIVSIPSHKKGPVYTVMQAESAIDETLPTLVNYCDFSFSWDPEDFVSFVHRRNADGAILCYKGFHPHYLGNTLYAYCRHSDGLVQEVKEKGHFTPDRTQEYASSGTYFFASGALVKRYFQQALDQQLELNGEYYVSLVYNLMIRDAHPVYIFEIPFFLQWGTPEDLQDYLYWHRVFDYWARWKPMEDGHAPRLLMPMAGHGTRFGMGGMPKPLIPVLGQPMFTLARNYLPCTLNKSVFVVRSELEASAREAEPEGTFVVLPRPTEGQADSTRAGLAPLSPDEPVLVSACDHGLLWDPAAWDQMIRQKPDIIVMGQKGYPGARRMPLAFSYFAMDPQGHVTHASIKQPLTAHPTQEYVLVGTFYFARVSLLQELIDDLVQRDIRVNGERYLDSVVPLAIQKKLKIYGFACQAYLNWGTPETIKEFDYWYRYFMRVYP